MGDTGGTIQKISWIVSCIKRSACPGYPRLSGGSGAILTPPLRRETVMGPQIRSSHARIDHIRVGHVNMHGEGRVISCMFSFPIRHGEDEGEQRNPLTGPIRSAKGVQKARGSWNPHLPKLPRSSGAEFPLLIHGERSERPTRAAET